MASSVGNTPPVQRSSLTDLTKAGMASTASISAEVIRERIAKSSSHQDVQVDIHQPKQPQPDETDVGPLLGMLSNRPDKCEKVSPFKSDSFLIVFFTSDSKIILLFVVI